MKKLEDYLYYEEKDPDLKIYHGDCLEIMPLLPKVDLVVTDPPYGINVASNGTVGGRKLAAVKDYGKCEWDKEIPKPELFKMIYDKSENQVIFGGNYFAIYLSNSPCWLVWDKDNTGNFADCELVYTSFKSATRKIKYRWNGMLQGNMKEKEFREHPTQKPVPVLRWIIEHYHFNGIVLDPYLGSGTTLVACKELNRNGIGIEINEKYCEIAKKRLRATCKPLFTDVNGAGKNTKENVAQKDML